MPSSQVFFGPVNGRLPKGRQLLSGLGLCAMLSLVTACGWAAEQQPPPAAPSQPNVILVMTDDQGFGDVGVHGNDTIRTPHLDRFAREGVRFERFYCSQVCAPTRAALMTGRYHYRTGVIHTSRGGAKMHGDEVTIAELFSIRGYQTGVFGKWHLGDNYPMRPQDQGFGQSLVHRSGGIDQVPDKPNSYFAPLLHRNGVPVEADKYCTDAFFEAAMEFIRENRGRPFFAYIPTNAPHTPLQVPEQWVQPYLDAGLDETTAKVYAMVTNIDENFGRLLSALDELNLRRQTLVIFLTDNGPQQPRYTDNLRGRKATIYEGGLRVPCFVQWPNVIPGGRAIPQMAAHVDWVPTLADICGLNRPAGRKLDGVSLKTALLGQTGSQRDRMLFFQTHRGLSPQRYQNATVITPSFKLLMTPGTFGVERAEIDPQNPSVELYNLADDRGETTNLADRHPEVVRKLKTAYEAWFADVSAERNFTPGWIALGTPHENPTLLCRYQDASFEGNHGLGWPVRIEKAGVFQIHTRWPEPSVAGTLHVTWQEQTQTADVDTAGNGAVFKLAAGEGLLEIRFEPTVKPPPEMSLPQTAEDAIIERIGD